jgi:hypothetical protein
MLYGYGCKRDLVTRFIKEELHEGAVVVVHARKKRVTAKQIILTVARSVLPSEQCAKCASRQSLLLAWQLLEEACWECFVWNPVVCTSRILCLCQNLCSHVSKVLFLLLSMSFVQCRNASVDALVGSIAKASSIVYLAIFNMDAPSLRNPTDQSSLAQLARCPNVRLIATTEHPKSSLLFSFNEVESFRFLWHHVPTFTPLMHETLASQPILAAQRGQEVKQSAGAVLQVLTQGARAVRLPIIACASSETAVSRSPFRT